MVECLVKNCDSSHDKRTPGVTYHRFPISRKRTLQWIKILGFSCYKIRTIKTTDRICSKHFLKEDFVKKLFTDNRIRTFLKPGSLPLPPLEDPEQKPRSKYKKMRVSGCSVKNCENTMEKRIPGVTFHRFPCITRQARQWVEILGFGEKYKIRKTDRVCSKHFAKSEFEERLYTDNTLRRLKHWALPLPPLEDPQQVQESSLNSKPLVNDKGRVTAVENVEVKKEPAEDDYGLTTVLISIIEVKEELKQELPENYYEI